MKGRELQSGEVGSTQFLFHPLPHFLGCILGVSDGQDFIGTGVPFTNQMGDAFGEDGGLSRTRAGDDQNWPVDVFDRLALMFVQFDCAKTWIGFCDCHWLENIRVA
jgi:hypothetical protein